MRSHIACCEGCMFSLLVLASIPGEGSLQRFPQPVWNTACVSTEAFLGQNVRAHPIVTISRQEKWRSETSRRHLPTCLIWPQPKAASHYASCKQDQPRLWLLRNKSTRRQLASLLTGGRVVCGRKPEEDVNSGLLHSGVCVCARARACT